MGGEQASTAADQDGAYGYRPKLVWNAAVQQYLIQAYGPSQFAQICLALTRPSITSTVRVNTQQSSTQKVMTQLRQHFQGKSLSIMETDVVAQCNVGLDKGGSFSDHARNRGVEGQYRRAGLKMTVPIDEPQISDICWEHPVLKDVVMVRGRGPCDIDSKDVRGKSLLKEVLVSRKCAEAVLRGANVFVPGVLACSLHIEKGDEVAVTVAVERPDSSGGWDVGITRGTTLDSKHARAQLLGSMHKDLFIGKGHATMSRAALFKENRGVAVEMSGRIFDLPPFHGLLTGHIFLQHLPSIVATRVLDPKPGERILDMCAAPGGKTTAIAILMKDKGDVIALDRSHHKVLDIQRLSEEMMLTCIRAYKMDATKAVKKSNNTDMTVDSSPQSLCCVHDTSVSAQLALEMATPVQPNFELHQSLKTKDGFQVNKETYTSQAAARKQARKLKNMSKRGQIGRNLQHTGGFELQSFDRVLLDAPCSALGLRPRLFAGEETLEGLRSHACYQRKMIDQAVQLVRPGGTLVYSTCTINPGENEAVVRYALDTYGFLSLMPQEPRIGGPGLVGGLDVFDGMSYKEWLREEEKDLVQRFSPAGDYDTIGFFIAKFAVHSKNGQFDAPSTPTD